MTRITLNVDIAEVGDLLERVPRACLTFTGADGPRVEPVTLVCNDDRYVVGMPPTAASQLTAREEVVLLVDDGVLFFDLRAIYVRGRIEPMQVPAGLDHDLVWFTVVPTRSVAWDYARIREADDEA